MLGTTIDGIFTVPSAFAQGENMSTGGNYTERNMTGTDMAGSGLTTNDLQTHFFPVNGSKLK